MNILIYGAGYVGYPLGLMLSKNNTVFIAEVDNKKIVDINHNMPVIEEDEIDSFLECTSPNIKAISSENAISEIYDLYIIATPTNYDESTNFFDTSSIEKILCDINSRHEDAYIVIKSTVPVGFTSLMRKKFPNITIDVCPEFIREGNSFHDNNFPSRLVISNSKKSALFIDLVINSCEKKDVKTIIMPPEEAESVKLFSNSYLAMRVAYFNELDSFAISNSLDTNKIIEGVSSDLRIGDHYNNPSFGYGGYCLPKDTKQLKANFANTPSNLIQAIIESNQTRKKFLANLIIDKKPKVVGIYRIVMKEGSNNYRSSAILDIISFFMEANIQILIYEPTIKIDKTNGCEVIKCIEDFKLKSDLIIANRTDSNLENVFDKVFTRDIFHKD